MTLTCLYIVYQSKEELNDILDQVQTEDTLKPFQEALQAYYDEVLKLKTPGKADSVIKDPDGMVEARDQARNHMLQCETEYVNRHARFELVWDALK
jgi:hypothetical protein